MAQPTMASSPRDSQAAAAAAAAATSSSSSPSSSTTTMPTSTNGRVNVPVLGSASALPVLSRQPLPLSATQESQVRDIYYKRVRNKCADEVRDFAACASNRTFTAPFICRAQRRAMNTCMLQYANQAEQDAARAEWFATIDKRRKEREDKELKRIEQEKFHREWWGLDEEGKRKRRDAGQAPPAAEEAKGK